VVPPIVAIAPKLLPQSNAAPALQEWERDGPQALASAAPAPPGAPLRSLRVWRTGARVGIYEGVRAVPSAPTGKSGTRVR
jgi:hypothetical protein